MPTRWETLPVELNGGIVSNLSRLQQGVKQPGSARLLVNFEPSIQGGYRRINGYSKYDSSLVPPYGDPVVQGSGQTGTTLVVSDLHEEPQDGDTLTISGVSGSYTIAASGVSYSSTNKEATLTLTSSLDSSPSDKASVTFTSGESLIEGVYFSGDENTAYALRGGCLWKSTGSGWTKINTPDYGSPTVNGGSQTGTSLAVHTLDSDTYVPQVGDTFSIAGVEKVYTVLAVPTVSSGGATLSIYPALASSPAANATLTFRTSSHTSGTKARFLSFNFDGTIKNCMVDNQGKPVVFTSSTYKTLQGSSDVVGATQVEEFKNHLFFSKNDLVTFTAPLDEDDFEPGNGAGSFRMPSVINGMITFRDQLFVLSQTAIKNLSGSSSSDFALTSITSSLGCVSPDTVQEVGGDVLFLGPDGVRFLGSTQRIGDFNLSLASRQIQKELTSFIVSNGNYCSCTVREKGQYRIFRYVEADQERNAQGFIGTQFGDQSADRINWGQTKGIKAYRAYSAYSGETETVLFTNRTGYVYQMESGESFDGTAIKSFYYGPYLPVMDPVVRKTGYKVTVFIDPESTFAGKLSMRYDFDRTDKIQPNSVSFDGGVPFFRYGEGTYGTDRFGIYPSTAVPVQITGSFFTASAQFEFEGGPPFLLDTFMLEYSIEDRK